MPLLCVVVCVGFSSLLACFPHALLYGHLRLAEAPHCSNSAAFFHQLSSISSHFLLSFSFSLCYIAMWWGFYLFYLPFLAAFTFLPFLPTLPGRAGWCECFVLAEDEEADDEDEDESAQHSGHMQVKW